MNVGQLMKGSVQVCSPEDSLNAAARLMWEGDCGCVPVVEDGRVRAVLTDRDICMAAYTRNLPLTELRVAGAMSKELFSCKPADSLAVAAQLMRAHQVRRLPVVDADGRLVGILSLNDLAQEAFRERGAKGKKGVTADAIALTLGAICEATAARSLASAA